MPKQINHAERRVELAEAVWQIILRDGINKVSVRTVAAESGWSVGSVRYYFPKQEDLLTYALEVVVTRIDARIERIMASLRPGENELDVAIRIIEQGLPIDEERRAEFHVWIAFIDRSRVDEKTQALVSSSASSTRHLCRSITAMLLGSPPPAPNDVMNDIEEEHIAVKLHILWNGLSYHSIVAPHYLTPNTSRAMLQEHLEQIQAFGQERDGVAAPRPSELPERTTGWQRYA